MTARMLSLAFALAVCMGVALPQFANEPGRIMAGLVYMLAGVLLAAPRLGQAIAAVPAPRLMWREDR